MAKFQSAVGLAQNLIPLRHGPVVSRPGMAHVALSSSGSRLVPFVCSNATSYLLVFSNLSVAVYKNGVFQTSVVTPYPTADLRRLKYAQLGNVLTICHANHAPRELTRISDTSWTLSTMSTTLPAASFGSGSSNPMIELGVSAAVVATMPTGGASLSPSVLAACGDYWHTLREGGDRSRAGRFYRYDGAWPSWQAYAPDDITPSPFSMDTTHAFKPWRWKITALVRGADGVVRETAPFSVTNARHFGYKIYDPTKSYSIGDRVSISRGLGSYHESLKDDNVGHLTGSGDWTDWWTTGTAAPVLSKDRHIQSTSFVPDLIACAADLPVRLSWNLDAWTYPVGTTWRYVGWNVYRGLDGQDFGFVGLVNLPEDAGGSFAFDDYGDTPDYSRPPPSGTDPFKVYSGTGSLVATENPSVVAFFEQRRVFAAPYSATTGGRLGWIIASAVGDYSNFDQAAIQTAGQTYSFELASQRFEEIRSLVPSSKLLAFTSGSEWAIGGAGGAPLSYSNVDAKVQGSHGSSWLDPLVIGNEAIYVQERGPHVQSLVFDFGTQSWDGDELNTFADHLLDGHEVVAWAWAHQPYHAVFLARDDGTLLSMTYQKEQQVLAWARHITDGEVTDVCTVPEGAEDTVYLLVHRHNRTLLEKLGPEISDSVTDAPVLDGYTHRQYTTPRFVLLKDGGGTISNGDLVTISCDENTWFAEEGTRHIYWNPNVTYYGSTDPTVGDLVTYDGKCFKALTSSVNVVPGMMGSGSDWADFYAYDAGTTYVLNAYVFVVSGSSFLCYRSLQAGNVGHTPATSPTYWEGVPLGSTNLLVVEATKPDGDTMTLTVRSSLAGTGRSSAKDMLAVVSGQTTAGVTNGTAFTQWRRVTTHVPLPHWGGVGDTFSFDGAKFHVSGPALNGFIFTADGTLHAVGSGAGTGAAAGEVYVLGPSGGSAPLSVPATSDSNMAAAEIGTPFTQELDQLPPSFEGKEVHTLHVSVVRMSADVIAFGQMEMGQDAEHLQTAAIPSEVSDPLAMVQTLVEVRAANRWTKGAVGVVRQRLPLPMKVLGIVREVEFQKS